MSLLEDLCKELDISVSELLAGKRIEPERYQQETEKMLVDALGKTRLYGFQAVTYALAFMAVLAFYIPLLTTEKGGFLQFVWPQINVVNVLCWTICIVILVCITYLDRKLPGRQLRSTNPWLEGALGGMIFLSPTLLNLLRDSLWETGGRPLKTEEVIMVGAVLLAALIVAVGIRVHIARSRRRKLEEQERRKK